MFDPSSLCPIHNSGQSPAMGGPGFPGIALPGGLAMDRLGAQPLEALAAPSHLTGQFQQMLQTQQLMQLMSLLLALMQNRGLGQQGDAKDSGGVNAIGGGGSDASGGGSQASGSETAKAASGNGSTVTRQGKPIGAHIAKQFDSMVAAAKQDGVNITITSGARSRAEQERLYAAYKNGTGNLAAKPGTSNHESGDALDLGPPSAYAWLKQNAGRFGFLNKIASEPWHWSLTGN